MNKLYVIFTAVLLVTGLFQSGWQVIAQVPEKMSYQAVIRDNNDQLVTNSDIGMQISILQDSLEGTSVYIERHFLTTNQNGLISIVIGDGTVVSGNLAIIDWSEGPYFLKTETDLNGGANYTVTGTSQLLSVPYALYADSCGVNGSISLGNWETGFSLNTVYQAATDGFVVVYAEITASNTIVYVKTDENSIPTTVVGEIRYKGGTMTIPIKKNDYWQVSANYTEYITYVIINWIPLN